MQDIIYFNAKKTGAFILLLNRKDIRDMASIAIITGATGGLGQEFVRETLKENIDEIWAVARNEEKLGRLKDQFGDKLRTVQCDLSKADDLAELNDLIIAEKPDIRLLINNAGMGASSEFSAERYQKQWT